MPGLKQIILDGFEKVREKLVSELEAEREDIKQERVKFKREREEFRIGPGYN